MDVLKNMAVKTGYIHPSLAKQVETIGSTGVLYPISDFENKRRGKLGLPSLPTENREVQELFKIMGLTKVQRKKGSV
jgi:heterodisulfide reductase subunit C